MRRTGVRVSLFRNSFIHKIFSEFLQPLRDVGTERFTLFLLGFLFIWIWCFIGLLIIRSPRSVINRSWHVHWRDVTLNLILSFSSLNFTYCRWRRWGWRRWWRMTLLSWRCPWSWWRSRTSPFQNPPATNSYTKNSTGKMFVPNWRRLDWSVTRIRKYPTTAWFSKTSFIKWFPICLEVSVTSQTTKRFLPHRTTQQVFIRLNATIPQT